MQNRCMPYTIRKYTYICKLYICSENYAISSQIVKSSPVQWTALLKNRELIWGSRFKPISTVPQSPKSNHLYWHGYTVVRRVDLEARLPFFEFQFDHLWPLGTFTSLSLNVLIHKREDMYSSLQDLWGGSNGLIISVKHLEENLAVRVQYIYLF